MTEYERGYAEGHKVGFENAMKTRDAEDPLELVRVRLPIEIPMFCDITKAITKRGRYPDARTVAKGQYVSIVRGPKDEEAK